MAVNFFDSPRLKGAHRVGFFDLTLYDYISNMFHLPRWVEGILGGLPSPPLDEPVDKAWNHFLKQRHMKHIMAAKRPRHFPKKPKVWFTLCKTASRLYKEMEKEDIIMTLPIVHPTFYLLLRGTFFFSTFAPKEARKLLFENANAFEYLIHAVVATQQQPQDYNIQISLGFLEHIVQSHPEQLTTCFRGSTPLHALCSLEREPQEERYSWRLNNGYRQRQEEWITLFCKACPSSAAIPAADGSYPLHRACFVGLTWRVGLRQLIQAYPHACTISWNQCQPFELAAIAHAKEQQEENKDKNQHDDLAFYGFSSFHRSFHMSYKRQVKRAKDLERTETLYQLLLQDPSVVKDWTGVESKQCNTNKSCRARNKNNKKIMQKQLNTY